MRQAHPFSFKAAALLIATASSLALAQAPAAAQPTRAEHSVLSPTAPTLPLQHQPLASSGAIAEQADDWKAANAAVAVFARGHADVIKWEKAQSTAQSAAKAKTITKATSEHSHHHSHGEKP